MVPTELHPSVEELTAFSTGQLPSGKAEAVESHVGACTPCCDTLMGLSTDDTFVGLLQDAQATANCATIIPGDPAQPNASSARQALADHPRYNIVKLIARGGMGEVYLAMHRMMDRTVALKVINSQFIRNTEAIERFQREVKTAAQLSHPNIVAAYDAEQANGVHFLAMEHVNGVNLADVVKTTGPLSVAKAADYVHQTAVGLQYAHHKGMVHRDIKPHNLMLTSSDSVKILDFGLASLAKTAVATDHATLPNDASLTAAGTVMGTPDFISPEQAADAHQADIRSDIYSLGATLHFLLTGQPPFAEGSVAERLKNHAERHPAAVHSLRNDVPEELSDFISLMLAKNPDQRPQTPQQVADALAPFVDRHRSNSPPSSPLPTRRTAAGWRPKKLTAIALCILSLLLGGIIFLQTDQGTLIIESVDESVNVTISQATDTAGEEYVKLSVVDTVTGSEIIRLPSGEYQVSLEGNKNEYKLSKSGFRLTRGDDVVISVSRTNQSEPVVEVKPLQPIPIPAMAQQSLMMKGRRLSVADAQALQAAIDEDQDDFPSRLKLLGYYEGKSIRNPELRDPQAKLVSWLVQNYPEAECHAHSRLHGSINPAGYLAVKKMWLAHTKAYSQNTQVLGNAAAFFLLEDRAVAEDLLKQAQILQPNNAEWAEKLGQLYSLDLATASGDEKKELAAKAYQQLEQAMKINTASAKASSLLVSLTRAAFEAGEHTKAGAYAKELLKHGGDDSTDWNSGNATHQAQLVLGRLALLDGKVKEAGLHLLAAGKTSGSPQLNSFGPNMTLAKELLGAGERDVVLEYLDLCGKFWKNPKLEQWSATVKGGGTPAFGGNLRY